MILKSLRLAKWGENIDRMVKTQEYIDFYNLDSESYVDDMIDDRIEIQSEKKAMRNYIRTEGLTPRLIEEKSLMFQTPCKITNGEEDFKELLDEINFDATMNEINKLVNLTSDVAVIPAIRKDHLYLDFYTGEDCFVIQNELDQTLFNAFFYRIGNFVDTYFKATELQEYHCWKKEGMLGIETNNPDWEKAGKFKVIIDEGNGEIKYIQKFEDSEVIDFKGEVPVIMFRNWIPRKSFWSLKGNNIVKANKNLNWNLTLFEMIKAHNIPQLVISGDLDEVPKGLNTFIRFGTNAMGEPVGSAEYIKPGTSLTEYQETIDSDRKKIANEEGITSESISGVMFSSGYQLKLAKQEIINKNLRERSFYKDSIRELFHFIFIACQELNQFSFTEDMEIAIDFGEINYDNDPLQKEQIRAIKIQTGTWSPIQSIMEDNPDLDRDAAIDFYKHIQEENNLKTLEIEK